MAAASSGASISSRRAAETQPGRAPQAGGVIAIPLDGSTPRLLAEKQSYRAHIAISPTAITWMNELDRQGELQTLAR